MSASLHSGGSTHLVVVDPPSRIKPPPYILQVSLCVPLFCVYLSLAGIPETKDASQRPPPLPFQTLGSPTEFFYMVWQASREQQWAVSGENQPLFYFLCSIHIYGISPTTSCLCNTECSGNCFDPCVVLYRRVHTRLGSGLRPSRFLP